MKILLTASFKNGIFCNGLQQNIITLAELIKDLDHEPLIVVNHKIDECKDPPLDILIMEEHEIKDQEDIDICLQTGWVISNKDIDSLNTKNKNFKNIHIHYGNRLLADIEQSSWHNRCIPNYKVDEVWISPHYNFSRQYFKSFYNNKNVKILPYIWSDKYIKEQESILNQQGLSAFYKKGSEKNIGILEPNLNMTKHCLPSILICEELYNNKKNLFEKLNVYCCSRILDKKYFRSLMWETNIQKDQKVMFHYRKNISEIFAKESNVIVSNQLLNGLNYTYLEAIYFNLPLIHNSEFIKDFGYFYENYNTIDGAKQLSNAIIFHDENLEEYQTKNKVLLNKYSPKNKDNIENYKILFS